MLKFLGGMAAGILLVAVALTLFGRQTEVRFGAGDRGLLEDVHQVLATAIRKLDLAHEDHAAQLQRDLAEAEILTRIEERLGRRRILGEELPQGLLGRVELVEDIVAGEHREELPQPEPVAEEAE